MFVAPLSAQNIGLFNRNRFPDHASLDAVKVAKAVPIAPLGNDMNGYPISPQAVPLIHGGVQAKDSQIMAAAPPLPHKRRHWCGQHTAYLRQTISRRHVEKIRNVAGHEWADNAYFHWLVCSA
jgi:hypothetical protein